MHYRLDRFDEVMAEGAVPLPLPEPSSAVYLRMSSSRLLLQTASTSSGFLPAASRSSLTMISSVSTFRRIALWSSSIPSVCLVAPGLVAESSLSRSMRPGPASASSPLESDEWLSRCRFLAPDPRVPDAGGAGLGGSSSSSSKSSRGAPSMSSSMATPSMSSSTTAAFSSTAPQAPRAAASNCALLVSGDTPVGPPMATPSRPVLTGTVADAVAAAVPANPLALARTYSFKRFNLTRRWAAVSFESSKKTPVCLALRLRSSKSNDAFGSTSWSPASRAPALRSKVASSPVI
mmetsp:Transcript_25958/g.75667  ORF Transcript_25958/g.75667 Transcript_25958/m.75667 type:complete len:291 (-) Transcript_25958:1985-2857(-)